MTCPTCGGVVEDHVCTTCGAAVWPENEEASSTTPPPVPSAGATPPPPPSATPPASSAVPTFVNPPDTVPPPPPPLRPGTPAAGGWQPSTPVASTSTSNSSKKVLWWVLGGVGVLAVLGVVAVTMFLRSADLGLGDLEQIGSGSPERLAGLYAACDGGDMQACDDLYLESPVESPEEAFGDSCGNRNTPSGWCVDIHGDFTDPN